MHETYGPTTEIAMSRPLQSCRSRELPTQHRQRSPRLLQCTEKQGPAYETAKPALRIRGLGLPTKRKGHPYPGHGKKIDQVGAPEGLDEIRILVTVRSELVVKADYAADRRREIRETKGFEVLGRRHDARREVVERLVGREAQVMKRCR